MLIHFISIELPPDDLAGRKIRFSRWGENQDYSTNLQGNIFFSAYATLSSAGQIVLRFLLLFGSIIIYYSLREGKTSEGMYDKIESIGTQNTAQQPAEKKNFNFTTEKDSTSGQSNNENDQIEI